jgi:hypothetical protein
LDRSTGPLRDGEIGIGGVMREKDRNSRQRPLFRKPWNDFLHAKIPGCH